MVGIYFSGTGNTAFCVRRFLAEYGEGIPSFSIEESESVKAIEKHDRIVMGYPVQYSNIPQILRDYIVANSNIWKGKRIFVIATMGLFSGDGAGVLARLLRRYGAVIEGGLHLQMPDSIGDVKALKRTFEKNKEAVLKTEEKIHKAVKGIEQGRIPQEGLGIWYHLAGLFGQRLYFFYKTARYTDKLKIDAQKCIGCGLCERVCPMGNLSQKNGTAVAGAKCTMCYRCISKCPKQAITLLGSQVICQHNIDAYADTKQESCKEDASGLLL